MTVAADIPSFIQIPGNGSATSFAFPFKIFQATDLVVGFITTSYAQQTGGFTVQNVDVNGGGNVVFSTPPTIGTTVDIRSVTPKIQDTEFANLGAFLPEDHTEAFDRLTRIVQDVYRLAYTFGIHGPDQEGTEWTTLPVAGVRAGTMLTFDGNGLPLCAPQPNSGATQAEIGELLWPITAAEVAAGVTPSNYAFPAGNGYTYVERYGADPTGSNDSGAAFRTACEVMLAAGGGKIYALGALYLFNTWDTVSFEAANNFALFCLPANTELVGGGQFSTKLRISQTARTGIYDGGTNRTHIIGMRVNTGGQYVHDLEFDYDGIVQAAANDYCYFVRTMSGNCTFERLYGVQAPITNAIYDASTETGFGTPLGPTIVRDCWFQDCGPNMTGNSALNADCSYLYLEGLGSVAERNRLFNTAIANHNCGGIELHSAQYYATENYIKNCWPGMYLGVGTGLVTSIGSVVERNYVGYCNSGVQLIDQHVGLKITANHFEANCDSAGGGPGYQFTDLFTPLNAVTGANTAGVQTALSVVNNSFDCTLYRQGTARSTAGVAGEETFSINISAVTGLKIAQNQFISPTPGCITINGSSTAPTQDVVVEENDLINCNDVATTAGYIIVNGSSNAGYTAACVMQDIYVRNNRLWRSRSYAVSVAYLGLALGGGAGPAAEMNNVRFEDNYVDNVNALIDSIGLASTDTVAANGQNVQAQALSANGQTIKTAGFTSVIVTSGGAYTGLILQPGTYANQLCRVVSENANPLTMAASGTSNVADGTSCVIPAVRSMLFTWNAQVNLWYHD